MKISNTGKRLLSLALVLVMVFTLAPQVHADGNFLTEMKVEITVPVAGQKPDFKVRVPANANYEVVEGAGVYWLDQDMDYYMRPEDVFQPGTKYVLLAQMAPLNGYQMDNTLAYRTKLIVNNEPLDLENSANGFASGHMQVGFKTPGKAPSRSIATVTFKVQGGTWDGTKAEDQTLRVLLTDQKGMLTEAQIPTGMKPLEGYEAEGKWDVVPNTSADGITGDVTYTYSFPAKQPDANPGLIGQVSLTGFTKPVSGAQPDFTVSVPENANYHIASWDELNDLAFANASRAVNGMWWNAGQEFMTQTDTFANDGSYMASLVLVADDGYAFTEETTVGIDGDAEAIVASYDSAYLYIVTEEFKLQTPKPKPEPKPDPDPEPVPVEIGEVSLTGFTKPVSGAQPDFTVSVPENANYHIASWDELNDLAFANASRAVNGVWWNAGQEFMTQTDTFAANGSYMASLVLVANDGHAFTEETTVGIDGGAEAAVASYDSAYLYIVTEEFKLQTPKPKPDPKPEPKPDPDPEPVPVEIGEVALTGFTKPVSGAQPDFTVSVPENANYHIASWDELNDLAFANASRAVNGVWWNAGQEFMTQTDTFAADGSYMASLVLVADEGYAFAEETTVGIDGGAEAAVASYDSAYLYIVTESYKAAKPTAGTAKYTVRHMLEKLGTAGSFELLTAETLSGTIGSETAAKAGTYEGFTPKTVTQKEIAADGSTVVEIRYTRNVHTLTFDANGGVFEGSESVKVPFGTDITAPKTVRDGFTFDGWKPAAPETMPDRDVTCVAQWTANVHTHKLTKVEGCEPTPGADGWKDYYECSCGKFFEDKNGTKEILNLREWRQGDGKLPALGYKFLEGMNATWKQNSNKDLSFRANGDLDCFESIEVDGKNVDRKYYSVKSGSTVVKLKPEYLQTLKLGTHTLTAVFVDGECETQFKVVEGPKAVSPKTGDDSHLLVWSLISMFSLAAAIVVSLPRKKREY